MSDLPIVESARPVGAPLAASQPGQTPEQLRALAAQFESLLLTQMLKELKQSMFEDGESSDGFGSGPLADSLFAELGLALSRAGGIGLGQSLIEPLEAAAGISAAHGGPTTMAAIEAPARLDRPARLSAPYGWRRDPISGDSAFHKGIDLAMPVGQEVPAARSGEVVSAGELPGYGRTVVVKHGNGTSTRYAHLSEILVKPGDAVTAGQTIARSGATGRVTGPHLHFEVLQGGQAVDPYGTW